MLNRRKFLHNSSLGFLSLTLLPLNNVSLTTKVAPANNSNIDLSNRLFRAAKKRKQGRINRAITLFRQIIEDYPSEIRAYDGLRKTLLLRKYKELEVLELYQNGFTLNQDNPNFKERLAKEYSRLVLGNKKFTADLNNSENLLIKAKRLFRELKNEYPERNEYSEQLKKVKRKIRQQADTLDSRNNPEMKQYKKRSKNNFRRRFSSKNTIEVQEKLNELLSKPENEKRNTHIKELFKILIKRAKRENDFEKAFVYALSFYNFDKSESRAFFLVKKYAIKTENYDELVRLSEENHTVKNNFWSNLNRFDAYFLRYRKTNIGDLNEISSIMDEIENMALSPHHYQEFIIRKIKIGLKTNQFDESITYLLKLGNSLGSGDNKHNMLLFTILSSRYYKKMGNINMSIQILNKALEANVVLANDDALSVLISDILSNSTFENEQHIQRLNSFLERLLTNQSED